MAKVLHTSVWIGVLTLGLVLGTGCGKKKESVRSSGSDSNKVASSTEEDTVPVQDINVDSSDLGSGNPDGMTNSETGDNPDLLTSASGDPNSPVREGSGGAKHKIPELHTIYFDYDQSDIRIDQSEVLQENIQYIRDHPELKVEIQGHCDERGTPQYNFALGDRRAQNVRTAIIDSGVGGTHLYTVSFGEETPIETGMDDTTMSRNRRAEFWVVDSTDNSQI